MKAEDGGCKEGIVDRSPLTVDRMEEALTVDRSPLTEWRGIGCSIGIEEVAIEGTRAKLAEQTGGVGTVNGERSTVNGLGERSTVNDSFLVRLAKSIRVGVEPGRQPRIVITGGTDF